MNRSMYLPFLAAAAATLAGCSGGAGGPATPTLREPLIQGPGAVEFNQDTTSPAFNFKLTKGLQP